MTNDALSEILASHWQLALILRHFLSATRQRELISRVCSAATKDAVHLDDLVEEVVDTRNLWSETWILRPRAKLSDYEARLLGWVRSAAWQNDQDGSFSETSEESDKDYLPGAFLDQLVRVATSDFAWHEGNAASRLEPFRDYHQDSLRVYLDVHVKCQSSTRTGDWSWTDTDEHLAQLPLTLQGLATKHLSDLLVDIDMWTPALEGYRMAHAIFRKLLDSEKGTPEYSVWLDLTSQSICAALEVTSSRKAAREFSRDNLDGRALSVDPLLAANFGFDALGRQESPFPEPGTDQRVSLMTAPLMHYSHDLGSAMGYWSERKFNDASGRFWSHLRRLTALGSVRQAKQAKQFYGCCILERLILGKGSVDEVSFRLATRLLIESERGDAPRRIAWTADLVDRFVSLDAIDCVVEAAGRYPGVARRRTRVAVEILASWGPLLSTKHEGTIVKLWRCLAEIAGDFPGDMSDDVDVGRGALKALETLAKSRPEMISQVAEPVTAALIAKTEEDFWWSPEEAARTALAYVDGLPEDSLKRVAIAVLERLEKEELGEQEFTPFVHRALRLLVERRVRETLRTDDKVSTRVLREILRFGARSGQQSLIFFHLADFDESLLSSEAVASQLEAPRKDALRGALQINASSVTGHIRALLVAPTIAGKEGLSVALRGTVLVLQSAQGRHVSLGLASIDGCIFELIRSLPRIRRTFGGDAGELDELLDLVFDGIQGLWRAAKDRPFVLAEFALPPKTTPNKVVTHNLAFASLMFGEVIGRLGDAMEALSDAAEQDEISGPISLARSTYALDSNSPGAVGDPGKEDREAFYASLGRRMALLAKSEDKSELVGHLVRGSLRHGPDPRDLAVLTVATQLGLVDADTDDFKAYVRRTRNTRDLHLLLGPLLTLAERE